MSRERTRDRHRDDRDVETDVGGGGGTVGDPPRSSAEATTEAGRLSTVRSRAGRVFSPRAFLAALVAAVVGLVVGTAVLPVPGAGLVGVCLAAFLLGLAADRRHYAEVTAAGGVAVGASAAVDFAILATLGGLGVPLVAVAGGLGAVVATVGHYFGRDLRDGLTREL